ncbi:MAG: stage II sporulation protein P [Clostridia bacterium]|nr:stage II sporulation protein P [Clostridia bacterium]
MLHSIFFNKSFFLKTFSLLFVFIISCSFLTNQTSLYCFADTDDNSKQIYFVYDSNNNLIFEGNRIEVGDKIIDKNLKEYEIVFVDHDNRFGYAEYNGRYQNPKVNKKSKGLNFSNKNIEKSVGLYLTHNDESYVPTDGTSSIYGKGGIHDVAQKLKQTFEDLNYTVYLDETLHLPHDSGAYTRSNPTAQSLLNKNVDALFDIHRDGVARSVYVKNIDGVERCKVRIVVGQANPNKDANLQFAMYLITVAEEYCPWLFLDIYYAKGHYNQALTSKGLLFEMGTYLAEKELVLNTVPYLTNVIDKTLFSTIVNDNNDLTITDTPTQEEQENIVNNVLTVLDNNNKNFLSSNSNNIVTFAFIFVFAMTTIIFFTLRKKHKNKFSIKYKK